MVGKFVGNTRGVATVNGNSFWSVLGVNKPKQWYRQASKESPVFNEVEDVVWQMFRGQGLKGTSTIEKMVKLLGWLEVWKGTGYEKRAEVQVDNYLGALKRGGFIIEGKSGNDGVFENWVLVK